VVTKGPKFGISKRHEPFGMSIGEGKYEKEDEIRTGLA
jgi:hypothetical protein